MSDLIEKAATHLSAILSEAIEHTADHKAVVIYDDQNALTRIITEGYRRALPDAQFVLFDSLPPEEVIHLMRSLEPQDLVILVQSTNFRLNEFRIRIELFARGLKTIEHIHLSRISEDQYERYVEALAYDKSYYRPLGHAIKEIVDAGDRFVVECYGGTTLTYNTAMEDAKLNIGDYSAMKNVGGTFPIGEVFTEAKQFDQVNGEVMIFGYANKEHLVQIVEPFRARIEKSFLTAPEAPQEFQDILRMIEEDESVVVREFGLSLNPAMGKNALVNDITAFERQLGLHLSLGAKHAVYAKEGFKRKTGRYHVDVFVDVSKIMVNDRVIYENGNYTVLSA